MKIDKPSRLLSEEQYAVKRGYLHACMMADCYLGGHVTEGNVEAAIDDLHERKLSFAGREVTQIATYGDWNVKRYSQMPPAFGSGDPDCGAFFAAEGPKGLSMGFDTLPALLDHLREWDARELPECTC